MQDTRCGVGSRWGDAAWAGDESITQERWRRWDEDLVEEFALWLGRLGKSVGVLTVILVAAVVVGWI